MSEVSPNTIGLLAVAEPPDGAPSVGEWVPFPPGKSLNQIIRACNDECARGYEQEGWLPEWREQSEVLDLRPYDLTTVGNLREKDLKDVNIVLLDLEAIERAAPNSEKALTELRGRMWMAKKKFHLPQLRRAPAARPRADEFKPLPVYPMIITDEPGLVEYLRGFCVITRFVMKQISGIIGDGGGPPDLRAQREYRNQVKDIAGQIRDEAIGADLPRQGVINLARVIFSAADDGLPSVGRLQKLSRDLDEYGFSREAVAWASRGGADTGREFALVSLVGNHSRFDRDVDHFLVERESASGDIEPGAGSILIDRSVEGRISWPDGIHLDRPGTGRHPGSGGLERGGEGRGTGGLDRGGGGLGAGGGGLGGGSSRGGGGGGGLRGF